MMRRRMREARLLYFDKSVNFHMNCDDCRFLIQYRALMKHMRDTTQKEKHT